MSDSSETKENGSGGFMGDFNAQTLQSYEAHVQEYVDGTPQEASGGVKNWIDRTLEGLPKNAKIIEIGSAFGRDARHIEGQGYSVERTDAARGFVELLGQKGYDARYFNLITDNFDGEYDLVFANAVLLHFTREELELVLEKVYGALVQGGRFAFSLKQGKGEVWTEGKLGAPRFFCYWQKDQISEVLMRTGFSDFDIEAVDYGDKNPSWLVIVAER